MKTRIMALATISILILLVFSNSPFVIKPASAHITKVFGNYLVTVGWQNEPTYAGLLNAPIVEVKKGSGDSAKPVINALANMQISIKYGSVTKQLDFVPDSTIDGQYVSPLIPTKVGSYSLIMKGTIENQSIDTEIPLDDVASIDTLNFPQSGSSADISNIGQVGTIINQLTSDIEEAKNNANSAAQSVANVGKSFQEVKDTTDKLYMISMAGIGIGVAGIVIAVFAISRKGEKI
ncbi:MAG TPA: hypothetical protein VNX68_05965 [Nitrosopumilaceae archaeon]|jgi:hypothetical protein|nr:hypothetical protein [Nitrosopumilaceae archaeon]